MMRRSILLAVTSFALLGCPDGTDLGKQCYLVKKDPTDSTGQKPIRIKESEITPGKDFVSLGAAECDNLICVRDADQVKGAAGDDAKGYCSGHCLQTSTAACPSYDSAQDKDPVLRLSCRPLILDEATLAAICQSDPDTCKRYFGDTKTSYFCARGASADAGS
jgi:hypothetical protein